jgi:hypothetical protein
MNVDDHLDDEPVESDELAQAPEQFTIHNHRTANWLVKRIVANRQYGAQVKRWAESELKHVARTEAFLLERYGRQLEQWAVHQININGGRRRFVALPAGRVCLRRAPAWVEICNEAKLIAWCRANLPSAIITTERLLRTEVRHHVEQSGEVPDGAEVRAATERIIIQDLLPKSPDFFEGEEGYESEIKGSQLDSRPKD